MPTAYENFRNAGGLGQQVKDSSIPVTLASDSDPIPVSMGSPASSSAWTGVGMVALATNKVIKGAPGVLRSLALRVDATAPAGTYYVQLHDAAALPGNGAVPAYELAKVIHVNGVDDLLSGDFTELGLALTAGIVVALSTTEATLTVAGAYLLVQVGEYR